ncbi:MAG: von Willebrand factor type A domain-containing protein [Alphaproteobacteria bacterium]
MRRVFGVLGLISTLMWGVAEAAPPPSAGALTVDIREAAKSSPHKVTLYRDSHALVVSGSERRAVADAETVTAALKARGFTVETVANPKGEGLRDAFRQFLASKGAEPDARLVIWYGGSARRQGSESYLLPGDAPPPGGAAAPTSAIGQRELATLLESASARHVLMVLDACIGGPPLFENRKPAPAAEMGWSTTLPARQMLARCAAGEEPAGGGELAAAFVAALEANSPADGNGDGLVTGGELARFVQDRFAAAHLPAPSQGTARGFGGGEIVFLAGVPKEPPPEVVERDNASQAQAQAQAQAQVQAMGSAKMVERMILPGPALNSPSPAPKVAGGSGGAKSIFPGVSSASPPPPGVAGGPPAGAIDRERYRKADTNPVRVTREQPVSTFSIDVDTAAYANVRRFLRDGKVPPRDAVRIEEMVNYFEYDYPRPKDRTAPFLASVAVMPTPWNPRTQLLHIGLKGFEPEPAARPRANLTFLVDVSGSMQPHERLPLLKQSLRMLVAELKDDDKVAIVTYAGVTGVALEPTPGRERGRILAAIEALGAEGSTAGGAGLVKAYELAERTFDKAAVNRVILGTDGDFNVGVSDPEHLESLIAAKRKTGIYLSILGFGTGNLNDDLMQKLAQAGNGNAAYIDSLAEARKVLVDQMASTLFTIADDVKIQVEFNPARVAEYRLIGYETRMLKREDFANDQVDAGEIGSGHAVTALYELTAPDSAARLIEPLRYGDKEAQSVAKATPGQEYAHLRLRYKLPGEKKSRLIERPIVDADVAAKVDDAPVEARFAAAVAAFGQLLRNDPYTKDFTYADVLALAQPVRGADLFGYRGEFIQLVRSAGSARASAD